MMSFLVFGSMMCFSHMVRRDCLHCWSLAGETVEVKVSSVVFSVGGGQTDTDTGRDERKQVPH